MKSWGLIDDLKLAWNISQNKITLYAASIEKGKQQYYMYIFFKRTIRIIFFIKKTYKIEFPTYNSLYEIMSQFLITVKFDK